MLWTNGHPTHSSSCTNRSLAPWMWPMLKLRTLGCLVASSATRKGGSLNVHCSTLNLACSVVVCESSGVQLDVADAEFEDIRVPCEGSLNVHCSTLSLACSVVVCESSDVLALQHLLLGLRL